MILILPLQRESRSSARPIVACGVTHAVLWDDRNMVDSKYMINSDGELKLLAFGSSFMGPAVFGFVMGFFCIFLL